MYSDVSYLTQLLQWVNVILILIIIVFAYWFFRETKPHPERTPWILMFSAMTVFFLFEISGILFTDIVVPEMRDVLKTIFIAFMLYVFVFQNYLLKQTGKIVIEPKDPIKIPTIKKKKKGTK